MRIFVHIRDKIIALQCGDGTQEVSWLGNAAMVHYDSSFSKRYRVPVPIRKEGGIACDPEALIYEVLDDNQHVFAEFEDSEM
ncbi:unnamed protein product [Phytomonas sp. Hart1]|nr:unnamed protein product [Phytomonas sp. Hart1]|eukprot:CCW71283.1 unnamed protein product [Phytomonas sp. isolate Hart1]